MPSPPVQPVCLHPVLEQSKLEGVCLAASGQVVVKLGAGTLRSGSRRASGKSPRGGCEDNQLTRGMKLLMNLPPELSVRRVKSS